MSSTVLPQGAGYGVVVSITCASYHSTLLLLTTRAIRLEWVCSSVC